MFERWIERIDRSPWVVAVMLVVIIPILTWEIAAGADPDRLDWFDWLFWARQNYNGLTSSGDIVGTVMSPVQGLFGVSYPVNPFFNPLWLFAICIEDPALAHKVSVGLIFLLFSVAIWVLSKTFISSNLFASASLLLCINAYFKIAPQTKIYLLPTSTFNYFELMPPQNFSFVLAIFAIVVVFKVEKALWRVIILLALGSLALLGDPLYFFIYFGPIGLVIGIYYTFQIKTRYLEIFWILVGTACLYFVGILEYPLVLKETLARDVFNNDLFHSVKRLKTAPFMFQANQNILFYLCGIALLLWGGLAKRNTFAIAMVMVQIGLCILGGIYLSTSLNFNQLPNLSILDGVILPVFFVLAVSNAEQFIAARRAGFPQTAIKGVGVLVLGVFVVGKAVTLDREVSKLDDSFTQTRLVDGLLGSGVQFDGSISFLIGTRDSAVAKEAGLKGPLSKKHVNFLQNNNHPESFFGKYGQSVALISYWWKGLPTLEENNHLTTAFYLYFFRSLFLSNDDVSFTNINLFTQPKTHLYPMLGVRRLFSDKPLDISSSDVHEAGGLYVTEFSQANVGQYAPTERREVDDAMDAVRVMSDPSFDPRTEYVVLKEDFLELRGDTNSTGQLISSRRGIKFRGNSNVETMHVLPVLFSNCLRSNGEYKLIRVNLILTGIVFHGKIEDQITFDGPPLENDCLRKDKEDIEQFKLDHLQFPSTRTAHRPVLTRWENVLELFDLMGWW